MNIKVVILKLVVSGWKVKSSSEKHTFIEMILIACEKNIYHFVFISKLNKTKYVSLSAPNCY